MFSNPQHKPTSKSGRDWMLALAPYREPSLRRSVLELVITAVPLVALWALAWAALSYSVWLALAMAVPAAGFLVRLFMIQHDCSHGSFFRTRRTNAWVGRCIGVITLTPFDVWRRSHLTHHATVGNLGRRGVGDIATLTVREYRDLPAWRRLVYRAYRHPLVLFGIGPAYLFLIRNRLPVELIRAGRQAWVSSMATNAAIATAMGLLIYLVGVGPFLIVHLATIVLASSIGVWLFYIQHQFEDTLWAQEPAWDFYDAALYGSSYYDLPPPLRWFSANIGMHHVHHLCSGIPYYRLPAVLRDHPELAGMQKLTIRQSLSCLRLSLWDEAGQKLVSFADARRI